MGSRVIIDLVGGEEIFLEKGLGYRVIQGQALQLITKAVGPRVTHVGQVQLVALDGDGGAGGAHAPELGVLLGSAEDLLVRGLDAVAEHGRDVVTSVVLVGPEHFLDRDAAGHLAGRMSAQTIGHDGDGATRRARRRVPNPETILVVIAYQSHVRAVDDTIIGHQHASPRA